MRNETRTSKNTCLVLSLPLLQACEPNLILPKRQHHPHPSPPRHTPPRPQRAAACAREAIAGVLHTGITGAPSAVRARSVSTVGRMAVGGCPARRPREATQLARILLSVGLGFMAAATLRR